LRGAQRATMRLYFLLMLDDLDRRAPHFPGAGLPAGISLGPRVTLHRGRPRMGGGWTFCTRFAGRVLAYYAGLSAFG
jgi:hypothetical protein